jgi:glycerophosphoryl diester phosphodiesterase
MADVLILGHRGAAQLTENTIPSFEKALELGADGFELDVRKTADGQLIVVHGSVVGGLAVQSSTYEQLRKLPRGFEVPLLKDVLEKFGQQAHLYIELKAPGFEREAVDLVRESGNPAKTLVLAFQPQTLTKVHELSPDLQLGFIYNRTQDEELRHNCPIDVLIPQFKLASRELIEEVRSEGLMVVPFTVNEVPEIKRLLQLGVDGLITDYPEKVAKVIGRQTS